MLSVLSPGLTHGELTRLVQDRPETRLLDVAPRRARSRAEQIAERFRAFAEPARLHLLQERRGKQTVGELVKTTDIWMASASEHLQLQYGASLGGTSEGVRRGGTALARRGGTALAL